MGLIRPDAIAWGLTPSASRFLRELRLAHGEPWYLEQIASLRLMLCRYFQSAELCDKAQGRSIRPIGATSSGAKKLKVRWALPGRGRSGGLRLLVLVRCAELKVVLASAELRAKDPAF